MQGRPWLAELRTTCSSSAGNSGPQMPGGGHHDSWPIAGSCPHSSAWAHRGPSCPGHSQAPSHYSIVWRPSEDKGLAMGPCGWERGPDLASFQKFGLNFDSQKRPVRGKGGSSSLYPFKGPTLSPFQGQASYTPPSPALRQPASATAQATFKGD